MMKRTFMMFLPYAAAVLLATSCSKDDNNTIVDNVAIPEPAQETVVTPTAKTIVITGNVCQTISKVASDDGTTLKFEGKEEFHIFDGNGAECGTLIIQDGGTTYKAEIDPSKTTIENGAAFSAKLGNEPASDLATGYPTLTDALHAAYYEIPFTVKEESDGTYSIGDVKASIECAFVKALSSSKTTKLGAVTAGNFYIIPKGVDLSTKVSSTVAGKIYKVGGSEVVSSDHVFSVANGKTVAFSKGNLMYRKGFGYFFADKQWSVIGKTEGNISETEGTRDLFGWGTWLNGDGVTTPMKSDDIDKEYTWPAGATSAIGAEWSTLDGENGGEWKYLLETRTTTSGILYAKATVANVQGLIILPDDWSAGTYSLQETNKIDAEYSVNSIDGTTWVVTLESAGAVFLPAASTRDGTKFDNHTDNFGYYWSSSAFDENYAWYIYFCPEVIYPGNYYVRHYFGFSVRLVQSL